MQENWDKLTAFRELETDSPPGDFRSFLTERVNYIRSLMIQADMLEDEGKNNLHVLLRIDYLINQVREGAKFYGITMDESVEVDCGDLLKHNIDKKDINE